MLIYIYFSYQFFRAQLLIFSLPRALSNKFPLLKLLFSHMMILDERMFSEKNLSGMAGERGV